MIQKIFVILSIFLFFIAPRSFATPGKDDLFTVKKIVSVSINSLNVLLIFSAPFMQDDSASGIYNYYSNYCHQLPQRSFQLNGKSLPVCARCTGIALGRLAGELNCIPWNKFNPMESFRLKKSILYCAVFSSLILPLIIDGGIQYLTDYESNNMLRLATGVLYGIAITTIMDELVRIIDFYL